MDDVVRRRRRTKGERREEGELRTGNRLLVPAAAAATIFPIKLAGTEVAAQASNQGQEIPKY